MKKTLIAVIVCCTCYIYSKAQANLVINPSFEQIISCPTNHSQLFLSFGWDTLKNGGGGTPDLFHDCCTPGICGVPSNWNSVPSIRGFQQPKSGLAYAGLVFSTTFSSGIESREFMQSKLIQKLIAGNRYCVKIHVSLSEPSEYSCTSLGVFFDDGTIQSVNNQIPFPQITPQILHTGLPLEDTLNWSIIEGSFIANGTEEYLTIGNFYPNNQSGIIHSYPSSTFPSFKLKGSHYYIDDVSVIDISTPAYAGNDTVIHPGDSVFLGRQPEVGLNEACIWFVNGTPTDTVAGLWVTPTATTTYILQQTLCGNISYDTVTVTMDFEVGLAPLSFGEGSGVRLYPNPANEAIKIESSKHKIQSIALYDVTGKKIYGEQMKEGVAKKVLPFGEDLGGAGLYFIQITFTNGTTERVKFMKQ